MPSVEEILNRIETIEDVGVKRTYQTAYLLAARIGEVLGYKYESDKTAHPTGMYLTVKHAIYEPDLTIPEEFQTLMLTRLMDTGKMPNLEELAQVREEVAVFTITTEKRKGFKRETGLPLNPIYEPLTQILFDYIAQRQNKSEPVFPYYRQQLYPVARDVFKGFHYKIIPYMRTQLENGVPIKEVIEKHGIVQEKTVREAIPEHLKLFAQHALRHLRATVLRNKYGIKDSDLNIYAGWATGSRGGMSAMQDRYVEQPWRIYFPKLLRRRIIL
jgi:hypothetical protein